MPLYDLGSTFVESDKLSKDPAHCGGGAQTIPSSDMCCASGAELQMQECAGQAGDAGVGTANLR